MPQASSFKHNILQAGNKERGYQRLEDGGKGVNWTRDSRLIIAYRYPLLALSRPDPDGNRRLQVLQASTLLPQHSVPPSANRLLWTCYIFTRLLVTQSFGGEVCGMSFVP